MNIFLLIMGLFVNMFRGVFHFISSLLREILYHRTNRLSRGMQTFHRGMDEAELLAIAGPNCRVMISGGVPGSNMRERLETQLANQTHHSYLPVIILHRNNAELERRISALPNAIVCGQNERNYDPFRDLDAEAIADILLDNLPSDSAYKLNLPQAKSYIQGLARFYMQCLGKRPSLNSLYDCTNLASKGYTFIVGELQNALNQSRINQRVYSAVKALLDAGQSQEVALNAYLKDTLKQLASCTPPLLTGRPDAQYVSLRRAITRKAILCVDVSTVSDEKTFYNLFVNELNSCKADQLARPYLILDGIGVKASPALSVLLEDQSAPPYCICCQNVYASLNGGKPDSTLFNSLASGCAMHVTLHQPSGPAAGLWADFYGVYQMQKRSVGYNSGTATGHGAQLLPGASRGMMVQYTDVDEHICRPDEFTKLSDREMICAVQTGGATKYMKARLNPEP